MEEEGLGTTHSRICALSELLQLLERTGVSFAVHLDGGVSCCWLLATGQLVCWYADESILATTTSEQPLSLFPGELAALKGNRRRRDQAAPL